MIAISLTASACSTTTVIEQTAELPVVPEYVKIPHPAGFDLADLRAIFISPLAPKAVLGEFVDTCDEEFKKLLEATTSRDERKKGAIELVTHDPERLHWCFYAKISRLQDVLQTDSTWSARQKKVLESFAFLSPVANAFLDVFHDTRYLRWASQYYSKISEWVFFKKLAPTEESSLTLIHSKNAELETWVPVQRNSEQQTSVFSHYGITLMPTIAGALNPFEEKARTPASVEEPQKQPEQLPGLEPVPPPTVTLPGEQK